MEFKGNLEINGAFIREKEFTENCLANKETNEALSELYQLIMEINYNISDISNEDLQDMLTKVIRIIYNFESGIPDYFVQDLNCVPLFAQIVRQANNQNIIESSLIILQGLIYSSPFALDAFIQLDLTSILMQYLFEMPQKENHEIIISTILGIILKISENPISHLEINVIPNLFTFSDNCQNNSNDVQNLKICFEIFGSFIRYNEKPIIYPFLDQFLKIHYFLKNPVYQKSLIPLVCDLAEKGFISEIIVSSLYSTCLNLLNNEDFEESYGFIFRLIIQILNIFIPNENNDYPPYELTRDNLEICVPFDAIYYLLKNSNKNKNDCLLLYHKISEIGGLKILISEVDGKNVSLLIDFLENGSFEIKSRIFHLLWEGLFNLNNLIDQIFILNSQIFQSITFCVDFQEESNFLLQIFPFLEHILSVVPFNSNVKGINGNKSLTNSSAQLQLNITTFNSINQFVNDCIECDNDELMQAAMYFMNSYNNK